jgi:hypothetical protein
MRICFDMDGTIANLYAVENWLPMLRSYDPTPYAEAGVMLNMQLLARLLNRVQAAGNELVIVSWLSKEPTPEYDEAVTAAKLAWLHQHLHSVQWNEINIVSHGYCKNNFCMNDDDILFDDEARNRDEWDGEAYEPADIIEVLKKILNGD